EAAGSRSESAAESKRLYPPFTGKGRDPSLRSGGHCHITEWLRALLPSPLFHHHAPQHAVHAGLVASAFFLEPCQHVSVDTQGDRLLERTVKEPDFFHGGAFGGFSRSVQGPQLQALLGFLRVLPGDRLFSFHCRFCNYILAGTANQDL